MKKKIEVTLNDGTTTYCFTPLEARELIDKLIDALIKNAADTVLNEITKG